MNSGRLTLNDEVYNQIRIRISEGTWPVGEKIPTEAKLCEMFMVSRVSVRAAIKRLQGQGIIKTTPGVGSFVAATDTAAFHKADALQPASVGELLEFIDFRESIESKAIDLFPVRATVHDEEALQQAIAAMEASGDDIEQFAAADLQFHLGVIAGTKNTYLTSAMNRKRSVFFTYLLTIGRHSGKSDPERVEDHRRLYQALLQKRPSHAKERLLAEIRTHGDLLRAKGITEAEGVRQHEE